MWEYKRRNFIKFLNKIRTDGISGNLIGFV